MCLHAALCSIPFNLLCNMPCSEKVEFRPIEGGGGGGRAGLWSKYLLPSSCIHDYTRFFL